MESGNSLKLTDQQFHFGVWQAVAPSPRYGERAFSFSSKSGSEGSVSNSDLDKSLTDFITDSRDKNHRKLRGDIRKVKDTNGYYTFLSNKLDNIELILKDCDKETKADTLNLLFEGINNSDTSPENLEVGKKLVEAIYRITVTKKDAMNDDLERTVNALLERPNDWGYRDVRYLIYRGIFEYQNNDKGKLVAGYMMAKYGTSLFLDNVKEIVYDQNLNDLEKKSANDFLISFWYGIVPIKKGEVVLDWDKFYTELSPEYHLMTEENEGAEKTRLILEMLEKAGVDKRKTILDIGSGNGWLVRKILGAGYKNAVGLEKNDRYLKEAHELGGKHKKGNFHNLRRELQKLRLKPEVEIVNGRTIMHFKKNEIRQLDADIVIFDSVDPNTGAAKERLDKLRDKLTEYGFNREWLQHHFYNLLGTVDGGDHLGERLALPEQEFKEILGGERAVTVVRQENYDGQGTDNLVFFCIGGQYATKLYGEDIYSDSNLEDFNKIVDKYGPSARANLQPHKFYQGSKGSYAFFGY